MFFGLGLLIGVYPLGSYLFSSSGLLSLSMAVDQGLSDATIEVLQDHEGRLALSSQALSDACSTRVYYHETGGVRERARV